MARPVAEGGERRIGGVPEGYDAYLLAEAARSADGPLLHICRDDARLDRLKKALGFFAPDLISVDFPAWDCLPYDRTSPAADIVARRLTTLATLIDESAAKPAIVLTTISAVVQKVPPQEFFRGNTLAGQIGTVLDRDELFSFFSRNGYRRAETVRETGEYAIRGGIVDIFAPGESNPIRLDFFGEDLESIRSFDALSQRSKEKCDSFRLHPVSEAPLDEESIARFRARYRVAFGIPSDNDGVYEAVSVGRRQSGYEHWLPFFHERLQTLLDYLPDAPVSFDHQWDQAIRSRFETIHDHYEARNEFLPANLRAATAQDEQVYRPVDPEQMFLDEAGWEEAIAAHDRCFFSPFEEGGDSAGGRASPNFAEARQREDINLFDAVRAAISDAGRDKPVVVAAASAGSRDRLAKLIAGADEVTLTAVDGWAEIKGPLGMDGAYVSVWETERGFNAPEMLILSEEDILGERLSRPSRRRRRSENFISEVSALEPGDLVVHIENGIGRYDGLESLTVDGAPHDCVRLLYAGDDRLFIPVENIDTLSRYGAEQSDALLDKLGAIAWQARRAAVKERIKEMADQLLKLAAERTLAKAPVMPPPPGAYEEFCTRFAWTETEDQQRAIEDVVADMGTGQSMDRLICGDVGFGKTEVAMRAAFIAASNGFQVAIIVPTTLLAFQHHQTFAQRFSGLPVTVEQLSRLVKAKDASAVKEGLRDGSVDIVIGTHALLAQDIEFKNIGLLVIDEEQHFGVGQKERLKEWRRDLHVLTLTATPIPRTLQLALAGARDMSIIATPPLDRLAIRSFVLPFDPVVIREAINRERYRGGQVFYVCPRISDLSRVAKRLAELVPDAKVLTAHGQMAPQALEEVINDFNQGKADILLSTNIIEAGIDIPNANTMLVHRADRFGLSQLYQLRGRIGRAKARAYAYLTLPAGQILSTAAEKRLSVMQTLDSLGAGFTLASHDLDIRGAGNLLGEEQSGHIKEVGVELYQHMLEEAITTMREKDGDAPARPESWSPQISLGVAVLIPDDYVADLGLRLGLYRRLSSIEMAPEIEAFAAELIDRFGALPKPVENLLKVMEIKNLCRIAGIEKVDAGKGGASVVLRNARFANPMALVGYIQRNPLNVKLRPDQSLVFRHDWPLPDHRLDGVTRIARDLADLATQEEAA
ncbi:MAG: transcription-repair coupling factor [Rhodospirillaceae bacterium]|nr:transcription-repair coupling factor [Rhodospirillaceae bacterium]